MSNIWVRDVTARDNMYQLVEDGQLYRNFHKADISCEGTFNILIKAGSKYPFAFLDAKADGDCHIEIYIGTTVSADGTEMNSGNYNFNSSNTPETTFYHTPTITSDGTYVANTWILGGSGSTPSQQTKATASMRELDVILAPNTNYLIRYTNEAGRSIQALFEVSFKECT
jgi:hypothetical protein